MSDNPLADFYSRRRRQTVSSDNPLARFYEEQGERTPIRRRSWAQTLLTDPLRAAAASALRTPEKVVDLIDFLQQSGLGAIIPTTYAVDVEEARRENPFTGFAEEVEPPPATNLPGKVLQAAGSSAPDLVAMLAAGPVGGTAYMGGLISGQSFKEAKERGVSTPVAAGKAVVEGSINAILERVGAGRLGKLLKPMAKGDRTKFATQLLRSVAVEASEEEAEELVSIALEKATGKEFAEGEIQERVTVAPLAGAVTAGTVGGVSVALPNAAGKRAHETARRWLTTQKGLDQEAFKIQEAAVTEAATKLFEAENVQRDLTAQKNAALGWNVTHWFQPEKKQARVALDEATQEYITVREENKEAVGARLPENVRAAADEARKMLDQHTLEFLESDYLTDDQKAVLRANWNSYMRRSFKIHDDPEGRLKEVAPHMFSGWWGKPQAPTDVWIGAREWLREREPNMNDAQLDERLVDLYFTKVQQPAGGTEYVSPDVQMIERTPFMHRKKDLPRELLELFGEIKTPEVSFMKSIERTANAYSRAKMYEALVKNGLMKSVLTNTAPDEPGWVNLQTQGGITGEELVLAQELKEPRDIEVRTELMKGAFSPAYTPEQRADMEWAAAPETEFYYRGDRFPGEEGAVRNMGWAKGEAEGLEDMRQGVREALERGATGYAERLQRDVDRMEAKARVIEEHSPDVLYLSSQPTTASRYTDPAGRPREGEAPRVTRFAVRGNILDLRRRHVGETWGGDSIGRVLQKLKEAGLTAQDMTEIDAAMELSGRRGEETFDQQERQEHLKFLDNATAVAKQILELPDQQLETVMATAKLPSGEPSGFVEYFAERGGGRRAGLAKIVEEMEQERLTTAEFYGMESLNTFEMFRDQALPIVKAKLEALGYDGVKFDEFDQDNLILFNRQKTARKIPFGFTPSEQKMAELTAGTRTEKTTSPAFFKPPTTIIPEPVAMTPGHLKAAMQAVNESQKGWSEEDATVGRNLAETPVEKWGDGDIEKARQLAKKYRSAILASNALPTLLKQVPRKFLRPRMWAQENYLAALDLAMNTNPWYGLKNANPISKGFVRFAKLSGAAKAGLTVYQPQAQFRNLQSNTLAVFAGGNALPGPWDWPGFKPVDAEGNEIEQFKVGLQAVLVPPISLVIPGIGPIIGATLTKPGRASLAAAAYSNRLIPKFLEGKAKKARLRAEHIARMGLKGGAIDVNEAETYMGGVLSNLEEGRAKVFGVALPALAQKAVAAPLRFAQRLYYAGDDVAKAMIFYRERQKLLWMYETPLRKGEVSIDQIEALAAEQTLQTAQNYDRLPQFAKTLRAVPIISPFLSFPIASTINLKNQVKIGLQEAGLHKPDEWSPMAGVKADPIRSKVAGAMRLVSAATAATGAATAIQGLVFAARNALGEALGEDWEPITDVSLLPFNDGQTVEDMLQAEPWWGQAANHVILHKKDGKIWSLDFSYMNYFNYLERPILAAIRSGVYEEEPFDAAIEELLQPFLGADIVGGAIFRLLSNEDQYGNPIYDVVKDKQGRVLKGDPWEQFKDGVNHLVLSFAGPVKTTGRLWKAWNEEGDILSGATYDKWTEMLALGGPRVKVTDFVRTLSHRSRDQKDALNQMRRATNKILREPGKVNPRAAQIAIETDLEAATLVFRRLQALYQAGLRQGASKKAMDDVLIDNDTLSKAEAAGIIQGWDPEEMARLWVSKAVPNANQYRNRRMARQLRQWEADHPDATAEDRRKERERLSRAQAPVVLPGG